mmetsp:Transcript_14455/g.31327  ORF Transcript_14455/g.31327 Transcript_14455/m.31327 type:complete len:202 (+) Transcript_14455:819-1424(+)
MRRALGRHSSHNPQLRLHPVTGTGPHPALLCHGHWVVTVVIALSPAPPVLHQVLLPLAVVEVADLVEAPNDHEVLGQVVQLAVRGPVRVGTLVRPDDKARLLVEDEVAPQVIKHDGVVLVVLGELGPNEGQGLAVKHAVLLRVDRHHGRMVQHAGHLVVRVPEDAQLLHLDLHPFHGGGRPDDDVVQLVGRRQELVQVGPC